MDIKTLKDMTGLTLEDLMDLFIESSYELSDAYKITRNKRYSDISNRLIKARNQLFRYATQVPISELIKSESIENVH